MTASIISFFLFFFPFLLPFSYWCTFSTCNICLSIWVTKDPNDTDLSCHQKFFSSFLFILSSFDTQKGFLDPILGHLLNTILYEGEIFCSTTTSNVILIFLSLFYLFKILLVHVLTSSSSYVTFFFIYLPFNFLAYYFHEFVHSAYFSRW